MQQPDPVYVFKVHEPVGSLTFFNQFLQAGCQKSVKLYCLSNLKMMLEHPVSEPKKANEMPVSVMSISSNSERMITQHRNGFIKFWDIEESEYVLKTEINTNYIGFCRAIYSEDNKFLVAPKSSSDISIIDYESYQEIKILTPPDDQFKNVNCFRIFTLPDNKNKMYLIAGYETGHLVLWDIENSKVLHYIQYEFPISTFDVDSTACRGFLGSPLSVSIAHAFGIDKSKLELYKKDHDNIIYTPRSSGEQLYGVSCIRIRPDRKLMMVGTGNGIVYVHSMKFLRKLTALRLHRQEITDIVYSDQVIDGMKSKLTAISGGDSISLWDIYYKWND